MATSAAGELERFSTEDCMIPVKIRVGNPGTAFRLLAVSGLILTAGSYLSFVLGQNFEMDFAIVGYLASVGLGLVLVASIVYILSPKRVLTVLDIENENLLYTSMAVAVTAIGAPYRATRSVPIAGIWAITLSSIDDREMGQSTIANLISAKGNEAISFDFALRHEVEDFFVALKRAHPQIRIALDSK